MKEKKENQTTEVLKQQLEIVGKVELNEFQRQQLLRSKLEELINYSINNQANSITNSWGIPSGHLIIVPSAGSHSATILLSGIVLAIAFRPLFYLFHELSFRNDYWQLDPRSDYLVMLFPEGFWIDATLILVAVVFLQAIGILAVVTFFKRLLK